MLEVGKVISIIKDEARQTPGEISRGIFGCVCRPDACCYKHSRVSF